MPNQVARGSTIRLYQEYINASDVLANPANPLVDILDPANTVVVNDAVPTNYGTGLYYYDYTPATNATLGVWRARFFGTFDGFQVFDDVEFEVRAVAFSTYGATFAGVMAHLPHRNVSTATKLSEADVERFIVAVEGRIASRIGSMLGALDALGDADSVERGSIFRAQAASLVELGAAAWTEDALFPEGATVQTGDEAPYGARLWDRFTNGLDSLATAMETYLRSRGAGTVVGSSIGAPSYSFPEATIKDNLGW